MLYGKKKKKKTVNEDKEEGDVLRDNAYLIVGVSLY